MSQPNVVVVVLNWNGREDTLACLESLRALRYPEATVLVVDNGSSDGSEEAIRAAHPQLPFLQTGSNLGFAGGNNAGIAWALAQGADYVLLLNNDTEVEADFLDAMVERAESEARVGVVGAAIAYADMPQRLWAFGGGRFNVATGWVRHVQQPTDADALRTSGNLHFYVTGCTMLLSRELLEQVGDLDTSYFHFCEDVDLCLRAEASGLKIRVAEGARLIHKISATTKVSSPLFLYYNLRSRLSLVRRHGPDGAPSFWALCILWLRLWRPALMSGMAISGWKALRHAHRDYLAGAEGPAPAELTARKGRRGVVGALLTVLLVTAALTAPVTPAVLLQTAHAQSEPPLDARELRLVTSLWGELAGESPTDLPSLLFSMAEDSTAALAVLDRVDASSRAFTHRLLSILRWTEPVAVTHLPGLHIVRDGGLRPGQRPPTWSDVRMVGLNMLQAIAIDSSRGRDARLLREIERDAVSSSTRQPRPSEVAGRLELFEDWWVDRGMESEFYLDPDARPDVSEWLGQLRAEPQEGGQVVLSMSMELHDHRLARRVLMDQLVLGRDGNLVAECMALLQMYQEDLDDAGVPRRRWDPDQGRLVGYHATELRAVALDMLDRISTHAASGVNEGEIITSWLDWWQRARFEARYHRDPRDAPSLQAWVSGLDRLPEEGGKPMNLYLRETYIALGFRDLILDELNRNHEQLVAELVEWLLKDRGDAVAAGFDPSYRWRPLRARASDTGRLVAIPWPEMQALIRDMLRRITGDEGLPEQGIDELTKNLFWNDWWQAHRGEARWYRSEAAAPSAPSFQMERGSAQ